MINISKKHNILLEKFLKTKIKKILKNYLLLEDFSFEFLYDIYYKRLYFLIATEQERIIKNKINGLSNFTRKSMKDKYLLKKIKEYNKNKLFNNLYSTIKQSLIYHKSKIYK